MSSEIKLVLKKQEIEDFLRYTFDSKCGPIRINRSTDIGRFIHSMVRKKEFPISPTIYPGETIVRLILPENRTSTDEWKYIHFTREDMDRINDFLLASFNIFFQSYMLLGDGYNIDHKHLLEAFLVGANIRDVGKKFETLKKKDYRKRKRMHDFLLNTLQSIGVQTLK